MQWQQSFSAIFDKLTTKLIQSGRDIATRMRLLLLLVSKITHIYFSFLIRARYVYVYFYLLMVARSSACLSRH